MLRRRLAQLLILAFGPLEHNWAGDDSGSGDGFVAGKVENLSERGAGHLPSRASSSNGGVHASLDDLQADHGGSRSCHISRGGSRGGSRRGLVQALPTDEADDEVAAAAVAEELVAAGVQQSRLSLTRTLVKSFRRQRQRLSLEKRQEEAHTLHRRRVDELRRRQYSGGLTEGGASAAAGHDVTAASSAGRRFASRLPLGRLRSGLGSMRSQSRSRSDAQASSSSFSSPPPSDSSGGAASIAAAPSLHFPPSSPPSPPRQEDWDEIGGGEGRPHR